MSAKPALRIDVWSDIACPWCYVGKRHLEQALAKFPHAADVRIVWRAFELDPKAQRVSDSKVPHVERIARKYGMSVAQAQENSARLVGIAARDGIELNFDKLRSGNTFDAHRLLHLAHERGMQDALKERLMHAYFTEGRAIGDRKELLELAIEVGLGSDEVCTVLETDKYAAEVRGDEALAQQLGISGVPFFVMAGKLGVSGAQPAAVLLEALEQAWGEVAPAPVADGAVCGPDGCA